MTFSKVFVSYWVTGFALTWLPIDLINLCLLVGALFASIFPIFLVVPAINFNSNVKLANKIKKTEICDKKWDDVNVSHRLDYKIDTKIKEVISGKV